MNDDERALLIQVLADVEIGLRDLADRLEFLTDTLTDCVDIHDENGDTSTSH